MLKRARDHRETGEVRPGADPGASTTSSSSSPSPARTRRSRRPPCGPTSNGPGPKSPSPSPWTSSAGVGEAQGPADRPEKRLRKLLEDRAAMTVKRPATASSTTASACRGKWSGSGQRKPPSRQQHPPNEVFMTIVQPRPLLVRVTVPENAIAARPRRGSGPSSSPPASASSADGHRPDRRRRAHEPAELRRPAHPGPGRPGRGPDARHGLRREDWSLTRSRMP